MLVFCLGKIVKKAVVVNDEIVIRPIMTVYGTFDHRYGDAALLADVLPILRSYFEDPENFDASEWK